MQDLLNSLDHGSAKLKSANALGEKVMPSTSKRGRKGIKERLDVFRKDHGRLQGSINEARRDLDKTLKQWKNLEQLHDDLQAWIRDTEEKLNSESQPKLDLAEKKVQLEKAKITEKVSFIVH